MSGRTWHKGPPPHVGWWNASAYKNPILWRWWDGSRWSCSALFDHTADQAGEMARFPPSSGFAEGIEWSDYYPADARVPRVKP